MRVRKGWISVGTNAQEAYNTETKQERTRREHKANMMIRNVMTLSEEQLLNESANAYIEMKERKSQLQDALKAGKLRSKRLIAEAQS